MVAVAMSARLGSRGSGGRGASVVILSALIATLACAAPASAETAPLYEKMRQRFTSAQPGASTGWTFDGALEPWPAGEQVPPQRTVVFVFPRGTRIDLDAAARCTASDAQIVAAGVSACPARSRLGAGEIGLFLGPAATLDAEVHLFAGPSGIIAVFADHGGGVLRVLRATVRRNRIRTVLPAVPLPGGYELAVHRLSLRIPRAGGRRHPLLRTPTRCPASRRWTFTYLPRYDEPHGIQRSTSTSRCRAPAAPTFAG